MNTVIMIDSTTNVTPGLEHRFSVVPLTLRFGEEEFIDGVTIQNDAFYEKLKTSPVLPTTSQASPEQFSKAFREATKDGKSVVLITVSSALSGTFQSAMLAAQDFPGSVYVVDSKSVTIGAGVLAEYALALADSGVEAEEIFETLIEERSEIRIFGVLDTLEYLKKGGRISKAAALAGGLLSIKPVARIQNGKIEIICKARGAKQGLSAMKKAIEDAGGIPFYRPVLLGYTGNSADGVKKFVFESPDLWQGNEKTLPIASIGSVVGTHAGPGMIAIAFFEKKAAE